MWLWIWRVVQLPGSRLRQTVCSLAFCQTHTVEWQCQNLHHQKNSLLLHQSYPSSSTLDGNSWFLSDMRWRSFRRWKPFLLIWVWLSAAELFLDSDSWFKIKKWLACSSDGMQTSSVAAKVRLLFEMCKSLGRIFFARREIITNCNHT